MASTKFATGYFSTAADEVDNDEQLHQQMLESIIAQIETQARLVSEKYVELCQLVAAAKQLLTRKEFTKITEILGWSAAALNAYAKVGDAISCLAPSDVEHFDLGTIKNLANTKISSDVVESIEGGEKLTAQEVSERFKEARSLLPKKEKTPWVYIGSGNGSDDRAREFNVGRVSEEFGLEIEARMRETICQRD